MSKITNNTPEIFKRYQEQALRPASIEDGNAPAGSKQGKILTSEITANDLYTVDYAATVLSVVPAITSTGSLYNYTIVIKYVAALADPLATVPGYFGSNLVKENDPFVIDSGGHDWIRGIVNRIVGIQTQILGVGIYEFEYTLYCTINDGDPLKITINSDKFIWKRHLYTDKESFGEAYPPRDLVASFSRNNLDTYFYWTDVNQNSKRHAIQLRAPDLTQPPVFDHYQTFGNSINCNGSLQPFTDAATGDIACVKITDPGNNFSHFRRVEFTDFGFGAAFIAEPATTDGSLPIHEYYIEDISSIGAVSGVFQATPFGQPVATTGWIAQATPYGQPIAGIASFVYTGTVPPGPTVVGCISTSSGNGTGATFNITSVVPGYVIVVVNNTGSGYTPLDVVTIAGTTFGGASPADDIVFSPTFFTPVTYTAVPSTASLNGTGATFNVTYLSDATISVVPNNPGTSYQLFETITIAGTNLGGSWASNMTLSVSTMVPTSYLGVSSSALTGFGTSATFDVLYDMVGAISIDVAIPGINYAGGDTLQIGFAAVGGLPATNITFTVSALGNTILIRAPKTEYAWDYPTPQPSTYLEGLVGGTFNDYVVESVSTTMFDDHFFVNVKYAVDSSLSVNFSPIAVAAMLQNTLKIHNGVHRITGLFLGDVFNSTVGINKAILPASAYMPSYFIGTTVETGGVFPNGTYITEINNQILTLSSQATVTAAINGGSVISFDFTTTIQTPTAYTPNSTIVVSPLNVSGVGAGNLGVIVTTNGLGTITAITVDTANTGTGYTIGSTIIISATPLGGTSPAEDVSIDIDDLYNDFFILGTGRGYTSKARAKVRSVSERINFYLDPVWVTYWKGELFKTREQVVSVASIYTEDQKYYTEWTPEIYIKAES